MDKKQAFSVVNLNGQDIPRIQEDTKSRYPFVPFGMFGHDDFFSAISLSHYTSTTNSACVEGISDLIYGKGLYTKNQAFTDTLTKILPQEDIKKVSFDLKLYGNAAFQVYWDDSHTKIIKMYHIPVQYLRAEKLGLNPKIENYYYCTDWSDQRKIRDKVKIPAFETSNEKMEILYIKNYTPGLYYYSLPDWISALQFAFVEAEISNLHLNNIENGFLPAVMLNFNNGVPAPEERETTEALVQAKFTGTRNAGRFMMSFNDDPTTKPTIDVINIENLHEKYEYVADYAQQRLVVAHRVISPLLFGMTEKTKGFSSNSDEMTTAFSILQTMTIAPFQNLLINCLDYALSCGGYDDTQLYFEQLTPLAILSQQAGDTGQTIDEVAQDTQDEMINPATTDETPDTIPTPQGETQPVGKSKTPISTSSQFFKDEYEIFKSK